MDAVRARVYSNEVRDVKFKIVASGENIHMEAPVVAQTQEFFDAAVKFVSVSERKKELARFEKKGLRVERLNTPFRSKIYIQNTMKRGNLKATINLAVYDARKMTNVLEMPIAYAIAYKKALKI